MLTDRKAEILAAFVRLVSRFGIDKTTMQDVAQEVGISVGVIYKDFKNKEDLIDAYVQRVKEEFKITCQRVMEVDLPAEDLLHDFILNFFRNISRLVVEDRGFLQFIKGYEGFKYFRKYAPHKDDNEMGEIVNMVARIMEQGVSEGIFHIQNIPRTAKMFFRAFKSFLPELILCEQNQDEVFQEVEEMFGFLVVSLKGV